ncbi:hypothetical protein Mgra_00001356 [Meloidogyne graminicola]|uniref:Dolichyl-diphosphooligosaccharide--protein glycosyltransferase subunit KCP2 n=1 Tax=Meloidogyne graminicola TaxID=189291 RepID=A0A8T0A0S1_9BILA|nr:hypothetical protein Mgra_00001356 [Meloidogyne graminicola]
MATNNGISGLISAFFTFMCIGIGQLFKQFLSNSRQGNLFAGVLGAFVFCFALTSIIQIMFYYEASIFIKMAQFGTSSKSGLFDCFIALLIALISSALIHRIAITLTILFSAIFLFFLVGISHKHYTNISSSNISGGVTEKKSKKH